MGTTHSLTAHHSPFSPGFGDDPSYLCQRHNAGPSRSSICHQDHSAVFGCFYTLGVPFVDVLVIKALLLLLFGVYMRALETPSFAESLKDSILPTDMDGICFDCSNQNSHVHPECALTSLHPDW